MLQYSARKKIAKAKPEYSTLYPATNSASASGKSKGVLFVSAKAEIKNIIAEGKNGIINQIDLCASTISTKFKEPEHIIKGMIERYKETSYEIIWADERNAPKKAYLELLDQPEKITPYIPIEDTPISNNKANSPS